MKNNMFEIVNVHRPVRDILQRSGSPSKQKMNFKAQIADVLNEIDKNQIRNYILSTQTFETSRKRLKKNFGSGNVDYEVTLGSIRKNSAPLRNFGQKKCRPPLMNRFSFFFLATFLVVFCCFSFFFKNQKGLWENWSYLWN